MKTITFTNPHRKKHFDFFNGMDQPHFSLCANVEVDPFLVYIKAHQLPFTPSIVYCIAKTANNIPTFRYRIRGDQIVEHESVHPSFTVKTDADEVFSFCTVEYDSTFETFKLSALRQINRMKTDPSFEDEPGRDDYLFLSAIPWVSFTFLQHAMHYSPVDSVPRMAWGKIFDEPARTDVQAGEPVPTSSSRSGKKKMPLSVMAHHALVDGAHMGRYFELIQAYLLNPERLFE